MTSVLWYYTPSQLNPRCVLELDRLSKGNFKLHEKELLASRHLDTVPVDAIESKAYVLSLHEYCRFAAEMHRSYIADAIWWKSSLLAIFGHGLIIPPLAKYENSSAESLKNRQAT